MIRLGFFDNSNYKIGASKGLNPVNAYISQKPILQSDKFEKKENKKEISKTNKILLGLGLGLVGLVVGVQLIKRHRANELSKIPNELKVIFEELKNEQGEEFVNKAYQKLKKYMKLDGFAPENIERKGADVGKNIIGGHQPIINKISYTDGFFNKLSKDVQIGLLGHELIHSGQVKKILEAGKIEEYAEALAVSFTTKGTNVDLIESLVTNKNNDKTIENLCENNKKIILEGLKENHREFLSTLNRKPSEQEIKDADKLIAAQRKYVNYDTSGKTDNKLYYENDIEKEAYDFQHKLGKWYRTYNLWT